MSISDAGLRLTKVELSLGQKIASINWGLVLLLTGTTSFGLLVLYSLAGGITDTWVEKQAIRFGLGFSAMIVVALIDIRIWLSLAYAAYAVALLLLVAVDVVGVVGMGAQRWIDIGIVTLQPSELMKASLVLALARYFHELTLEETQSFKWVLIPAAMILAPAALVLVQPDLGTATLLLLCGATMCFLAGVRLWIFAVAAAAAAAVIPFGWQFLHEYQKNRILTFLDPERDPLGAGYHILQSKIALGAGGIFGRGFREGTQSHLNFLPEMQTDFIFTTLAEEFGMVGALSLLGLYVCILAYGMAISLRSRHHFGRLVAMGIGTTFFCYVFINIAMVTGLLPVVGVPLPLISYGGTAMVTLMAGFGLVISVYIHRDIRIPRRPGGPVV
ncbi:MAG: rod shape-determining protein RodA [Alphaproteobacteria bacterium]|nr:rod shape-determining protein RodA [Alphaproteobacteria bacterium]